MVWTYFIEQSTITHIKEYLFVYACVSAAVAYVIQSSTSQFMKVSAKTLLVASVSAGLPMALMAMTRTDLNGSLPSLVFVTAAMWLVLSAFVSAPVAICMLLWHHVFAPFRNAVQKFRRRKSEQQRLHEEKIAKQQKADAERIAAEKARAHEQERRIAIQKVADQAAAKQAADRAKYDAAYKVLICSADGLAFPAFLGKCPLCDRACKDEEAAPGDSPTANGGTATSVLPSSPDESLERLKSQISDLAQADDYPGLGNALLKTLMTPGCWSTPNTLTDYWQTKVPEFLAARFEISAGRTIVCEFRDNILSHTHHGDWSKDGFFVLVIDAYVLGATWKTLPAPHDLLCRFYQHLAERQITALEEVRKKGAWRRFTPADL